MTLKRLLLAIAFTLLFAISALGHAMQGVPFDEPKVDHTLDELVAARAKLIDRYVVKKGYAWGVSVCGTEDSWNGSQISYLTVYVYEDAAGVFNADLAQFGTRLGDTRIFTVDRIPIFVQQILRPKGKTHERPAKTERDDRQRQRDAHRASFTLPS